MLRTLRILLITICLSITFDTFSQAPGCPNVEAGPDTTLPCGACVDLTANFLETGQTTTYTVSSIPFAPPYPFTGGTTIFIGIDDVWTNIINIPFSFCFYGTPYNQIVIGSNGLISFDVSLANQFCAWSFSASIPTPGPPAAGIYNNSINGAFHDIDPSVFWPGSDNDINYTVLGTAPCRTFVVNYYEVPHFDCNNLATTQQIVLYETTNVIEIYILDKPTCLSWNSGNAVIGLQNSTGTVGITPLGRNTGPWTASNEAWRFIPDGPPNYTVEWYDGVTLVGTGSTVNVCPLVTTTYTGQVTYTNCDATTIVETDTVQVITSDCGCTAYISSTTDPLCASNCDGTATVSMISGSPPYTYSWSPSGGIGATGTGLCSGISYVVTITDDSANTCFAIAGLSSPSTLTVNISASNNPSCAGVSDGNATVSVSGGTGSYTYLWLPSGGSGSVGTGLSGGILYTVLVTDSSGCSSTDTITLNDPLNFIVNIISASDPLCDTSSDGSATVAVNGGVVPYSYSWSPTGGSSPIATGLSGGILYTVLVTDSSGCSGTDTVTLNDPPGLIAIITSTTDLLCDTSSDGNATVTVGGGILPYTYLWNDPLTQTDSIADSLSAGSYTVTVTDTNGCITTTQVTLTAPPQLLATISGDDTICTGDSTILVVNATGGNVAYTYSWLPSGGPWASNTFSPSTLTTYNVTVTDANGCLTTVSYDVEVNPLPVMDFTSDINEGCEPLTVLFNILTANSVNCSWDVGGATYNDCEPFMHAYNNAGSYDVMLIVTDVNGCTDTLKQNNYISVFPTPTADFIASPWTASVFTPAISFIDQSFLADCWSWDFAGIDTSTLQNPEFTFPSTDTGTYAVTLWVCTSSGCTDSITKFITIEGDFILFTPNSFTPNDDGKNDVFIPVYVGIDENNFEMSIYDRWGNLIYETNDINEPWDGKANGGRKIAQQDVYVWMIYTKDILGKKHRYVGHVTLVR